MQFIFIHTTNMHRHKSNRSFKKIVNRVRSKLLAYNGLTKNDAENAQKQASSPPKIKKIPRITNARSIVLTDRPRTNLASTRVRRASDALTTDALTFYFLNASKTSSFEL